MLISFNKNLICSTLNAKTKKIKNKKIMRSKIDGYKDIHTWSETNNYKIDIRCYTYFVCVFKESKFFQIYSVYIENESLTETKKNLHIPV